MTTTRGFALLAALLTLPDSGDVSNRANRQAVETRMRVFEAMLADAGRGGMHSPNREA